MSNIKDFIGSLGDSISREAVKHELSAEDITKALCYLAATSGVILEKEMPEYGIQFCINEFLYSIKHQCDAQGVKNVVVDSQFETPNSEHIQ